MEPINFETLSGIMIAVGLAAACGFRVFLPPFVVGVLHAAGQIELADSLQWMSSPIALIAFGGAMALEIVAYFVPVVDNVLDSVATPAAVVAGTVVSASVITDMSPLVQWSTAAIIGLGITGPVQLTTAAIRGASTLSTAGIGNPVLAVVEVAGSGLVTALGVFAPVIGIVVVGGCLAASVYLLGKGAQWMRRKPDSSRAGQAHRST